jgi:hypothetical protein
MEIWKDIPNQAPNYQVSNLGNVRSLDFNRTGITRNLTKQASFSSNYCVRIGKKAYSVAQFVLLAFVGERPSAMHFAHHKDGNPLNDCVENLEWRHVSIQNRINGKNGAKYQKGHPPHLKKQVKDTETEISL